MSLEVSISNIYVRLEESLKNQTIFEEALFEQVFNIYSYILILTLVQKQLKFGNFHFQYQLFYGKKIERDIYIFKNYFFVSKIKIYLPV